MVLAAVYKLNRDMAGDQRIVIIFIRLRLRQFPEEPGLLVTVKFKAIRPIEFPKLSVLIKKGAGIANPPFILIIIESFQS